LDNVLHLKAKVCFVVQFACTRLAFISLGGLNHVYIEFYTLESNWILVALAFIDIIWLTNLFNFLDGIDGYIRTEAIFVGDSAFILFNDSLGMLFAVVVLGFLFWNW
jgi:Fuc2NAc and GlcNAc transferase